MATVLEQQKNPASKFNSQVDEQLAQATFRIRSHDLTFGILTVATLTVFYASAMILLDKYLNLSEWVRQFSLLAFVITLVLTTYRLIVRPFRTRINPLYAAARVEQTIEDAKNSVMGYVEAQENGDVHNAVKAAMSAKAARAVGDADVNEAVDHRSLLVVGGIFVFFLLTLIVLFLVFRPTQFSSLIGRSFAPFSAGNIASQTQLTLEKPDPLEPTITTGQTVTVAVHVLGKVPSKDGPKRLRVLIRHNQADPDYEEIVLQEGETTRDWQIKIPLDQVLNGFWYKVTGGDAETPEYRVTVRSLPLFTSYEATYDYPAYTGKPSDKAASANIRAPRGTEVTLVARTNREVSEGTLRFVVGSTKIDGKPVPNQTDSLRFQFKVTESTNYNLYMTTTTGEKNSDSPTFAINVDPDLKPVIEITSPKDADITIPANGQLAVDANVGDDYGIDKVRLRLRVKGNDKDLDLAPIPFMGGQSFRRPKDNTWPKHLFYKDSVDLTKLKNIDGTPFDAKADMQIEYWVEAIDNCSEAKEVQEWGGQKGNVGSSTIQRVHLTAPKTGPEEKRLDQDKGQRKNEEKQHNQAQQQKFNTEKRDNQAQNGNQQQGENQSGNGDNTSNDSNATKKPEPKAGDKSGSGAGDPMSKNTDPKNPDKTPNTQPNNTDPKTTNDPQNTQPGSPSEKPDPTMPPKTQPQSSASEPKSSNPSEPKGMDMTPPKGPGENNAGSSGKGGANDNTAPMPQSPENKLAEEQANQVQKEIEKTKRPESEAKPNPSGKPEERTNPAEQKKQPPGEGANPDSQAKGQPDAKGPMNDPMAGSKSAPSESKTEGSLEKPTDPSTPKPAPTQPDSKGPKQKNEQQLSETRDEPLGGPPGQEKEQKQTNTDPKTSPMNKDGSSGSASKPTTDRKDPQTGNSDAGSNDPNNKPKEQPSKAGNAKPMGEPNRGLEKNPSEPMGGSSDDKNRSETEAAKAKPEKSSEPSASKPAKQDPMTAKNPETNERKPAPGDMNPNDPMNGVASAKPESSKPMSGGSEKNQPQKGIEKPEPKAGGNAGQNDPKSQDGKKPEKLDPKQMEELKSAAKDLNNPDPKKQEQAREKLDKAVGEQNRKALEDYQKKEKEQFDQMQKDLQSPDKDTREAAEKKLNDLMKQNEKNGGGAEKPLDPKQMEELKNAAKDLNNPDPKKQEQAREKLDKAVGEQNRKALEDYQKKEKEQFDQMQKDLQSPDKATREAAEKKLNDLMKQNEKNGGGDPKLDPKQIEELKNAAKDLNNPDPKKQEQAREKLDKAIGEQNRKALEDYQKKEKEQFDQLQKDLQSPDKATRDAAQKKVEDLMKQAREEAQKNNDGKMPTKEEIADLVQKAKDLNSNDEAKRKEAEKALDDKLGKEAREKLQEEMKKNMQGDPKLDDELQKKIEEEAKKMGKGGQGPVDPTKQRGPVTGSNDKLLPAIEGDPRNRAKTAELQLEEFEKNRYNRNLQDRLGWSPEQYQEFLDAQRKRVEQLQKEAAAAEQQAQKPKGPLGPPSINLSTGGKVDTRDNPNKGNATGTGAVFAPEGFEAARKKFAEDVQKLQPKK